MRLIDIFKKGGGRETENIQVIGLWGPGLETLHDQFGTSLPGGTHSAMAVFIDDRKILKPYVQTMRGLAPLREAIEQNFGTGRAVANPAPGGPSGRD